MPQKERYATAKEMLGFAKERNSDRVLKSSRKLKRLLNLGREYRNELEREYDLFAQSCIIGISIPKMEKSAFDDAEKRLAGIQKLEKI